MFGAYPMEVSSNGKNRFFFIDGEFRRCLTCPKNREKQINNKYYNFQYETTKKHDLKYFIFNTKQQKTNALLARRLWDSLWEEGWR
jgi:hypothetical protein